MKSIEIWILTWRVWHCYLKLDGWFNWIISATENNITVSLNWTELELDFNMSPQLRGESTGFYTEVAVVAFDNFGLKGITP